MYTEILQQLGLSKNEAIIFETLVREGKSSVGVISVRSKVHRRNVYDTINRLGEKGLVFEILEKRETLYQAVNPNKLMEILREKQQMLSNILPDLQNMYTKVPHKEEVYIYKGAEGWKNYMRDMLNIADEVYFIGAKGAWLDERVKHFFPQFIKEAKQKKIKFLHLFDQEIKTKCPEILPKIGKSYKFLPKGYSTPAAIDVFADRVYLISEMNAGSLSDDFSITVIVNPIIAEAFKTWFKFMWDFCPKSK